VWGSSKQMGAGPVTSAMPEDNDNKKMGSSKRTGSTTITGNKTRTPKNYSGILPPQKEEHQGKVTVVLDMDETMLHSQFETKNTYRQDEDRQNTSRDADFKFQLRLDAHSPPETVKVFKRPGLDKFLRDLAKDFEVVVFTAAVPLYAKPVLDLTDKQGLITHRLYRSSTVTFKGQPYVKDISKLGRDMSRIVLIDNNPCAMLASPDNVIPIMSFYDSKTDNELPKVLALLRKLKDMEDIRPFLIKRFKFRENMMQLLSNV